MLRNRRRSVPVGTYTTWWWPQVTGGRPEMSWQLEPRTDPSPAGYFWSHQFALVGGDGGYFGLQTEGAQPRGKIAIFSVWNARDAEGPEYAGAFGGEGTGMTVRLRHEWAPGQRETLSLGADGRGWWSAQVGGRLVGRIRVNPAWGQLDSTSIMWTERYGPPLLDCADMGHAVAFFGTPCTGGEVPLQHRNHLASHPGCPGSWVRDVPGGVLHVMGDPPATSG